MSTPLYKLNNIVCDGAGPAFGSVLLGHGFSSNTGKDRLLVIDTTSLAGGATPSSGLSAASHAEQYSLNSTVSEKGVALVTSTTSAAGAVSKIGFDVAASSAATGAVYGINSSTSLSGAQLTGAIYGIQSQATVPSGCDGTVSGLLSVVYNSGTAVTGLGTLSKIGLVVASGGAVKNSAFVYCTKTPAATPINATHGICVDAASVDTSAFALTSTTTPTLLWAVTPTGGVKEVRADATNATVAAVTASGMCGLIHFSAAATLAAVTTIDAVITNTFVNANSVIQLTPGVITVAAGSWIIPTVAAVGAGSWTLRLYNPGAATATGAAGVINVYYRVTNSN